MNKRGVSGVIVTVLMVLLVIAIVGVIWVVISNFVGEGAEAISLGVNTMQLSIVENSLRLNDDMLSANVERDTTKGELSGVRFVITDEEGFAKAVDATNLQIGLLETETATVQVPTGLGKIAKVEVMPIVTTESGKNHYGKLKGEAVPSQGFMDEGLVAYYSFDDVEGNEVRDSSGNDNHGTNNGASLSRGHVGQAAEFDGTNKFIDTFDTNSIFSNEFTLSFWILVNTPQNFNWARIIGNGGNYTE